MEISPKRLAVGLGLVFLLGIAFSLVNGYLAETSEGALPFIVYAIAFLSLLVGSALVIIFQQRKTGMAIEAALKLLPAEERTVIRLLLDNNGKLDQTHLVALSGYHKVKVHRILAKLVERGVVEKKGMGNTNLIVLKV
ncbi:MAG: helix-turn-helix domain-containing protein [Candidatus Woesearchaeota archaeon]